MLNNIPPFFRTSLKIFSVICIIVAFFVYYNTYIVDRSLINLRSVLEQVNKAQNPDELKRLSPLLKIVLVKELSRASVSPATVTMIEAAMNIMDTATEKRQIDDVKFYLNSVLEAKEKERGAVVKVFDRINSRIYAPVVEEPEKNLSAAAKTLTDKISSAKAAGRDKDTLQNLYFDLGSNYLQSGDIRKTEEAFLKVIELNPDSSLALRAKFNLAWAYKSAGEYDKAVRYFKEVAQTSHRGDLPLLSNFQLADILYKKGEYQAAAYLYSQISSEYPDFSLADMALYEAATISFYQLNQRKGAVEYLSNLENKFPNSRIIKHEMSKFRPALSGDFVAKGYRLLKEKQYTLALEAFQEAVKYNPDSGPAFIGMGLGYHWLSIKQDALAMARKAVSVSSSDELVLINALFILINSGKLDEAISIGERGLLENPRRRYEYHYNLGYAYIRRAQIEKATGQFGKTIKQAPDFIYAYNNLGCSYWTIRAYSDAIRKFREAIMLNPDYTDAHFNLGVAYMYTSRFKEAYDSFKKVLQLDPNYRDAQKHLNRVIKSLGYQP